jgi:hypothetical protein
MDSGVALIIGLDNYRTAPLTSCVNDARRVAELLERHGDQNRSLNYAVERLFSQVGAPLPGRQGVLERLENALDKSKNEDFVFYFSGHGASYGWGSALIVNDDPLESIGMEEILTLIHRSETRQVVVIIDACFSGSFGEISALGGNTGFSTPPSVIRDDLMILAASRRGESAMAGPTYSAFTELLIDGLEGGAADYAGEVTAPGLFGYAAPAFGPLDQRPTFKANLSVARPLRRCDPRVSPVVLRRILDHFANEEQAITLGATDVVPHDGDAVSSGQRLYLDLVELREGGYIQCPDTRHLSEHAAAGSEIRLTAAGVQMWRLVSRQKV